MEGLERCPFCGEEAREFIDAAVVGCMRCPAEVRGESPAEAVAAWNRRASDEAVKKARETLQQHLYRDPLCASSQTQGAVETALAALKEVE